jgi:glycosyltransferase involved in cell wall biosynthesis
MIKDNNECRRDCTVNTAIKNDYLNSGMVSVIVPVYNAESFIEKCLCSILNQTYRNLDIVIVDDGSTDKSGLICDRFSEKDKRIRVIHKEHQGVSSARNKGIEVCSGGFISFVDSDDYIHPEMIGSLVSLVLEKSAEMAICGFEYVDLHGGNNRTVSPNGELLLTGKSVLKERLFDDLATQIYWSLFTNKIVKKTLFDGLKFPEEFVLEDLALMVEVLERCRSVVRTHDVFYYYVQHKNSILHKKTKPLLDSPVVYLRLSDHFLKNKDLSDLCEYTLLMGVSKYRLAFWVENKHLKKEKNYISRKKEAKSLFRSVWKRARKIINIDKSRFIYYEMFYISFRLARFVCFILKK